MQLFEADYGNLAKQFVNSNKNMIFDLIRKDKVDFLQYAVKQFAAGQGMIDDVKLLDAIWKKIDMIHPQPQKEHKIKLPTLKSIFLELDRKFRLKKPVTKTDLRTSPGGDTGSGSHIKAFHGDSGTMSNSGITTQGVPGLSKAMGQFDIPLNTDPENLIKKPVKTEKKKIKNKTFLDAEDEIYSWEDLEVPPEKNAPVGSPVPMLGQADGNRSVGPHGSKHLGYRQR